MTIRQAHKRPESVLVVVHTLDGEILLLERCQPTGFWQSVTGSLEWGETAETAARRELMEETGLTAGEGLRDCHTQSRYPILPAWRPRYAPEVTENRERVFAIAYAQRPPVRLNPGEHKRFVWLPAAEAMDLASSVTNREAIRRLVMANDSLRRR